MRPLVLVHGRAQERKQPKVLKAQWIKAWELGLKRAGLSSPITREEDVRFVFYGDRLIDMVEGKTAEDAARVIVQGDESGTEEKAAILDMLDEIAKASLTKDQLATTGVAEQGFMNWPAVQAILRAIDSYVPYGSSAPIALFTRDAYFYTSRRDIRNEIEADVVATLDEYPNAVLVGHSLGSVITYRVLREKSASKNWHFPLYMTLGSPLAIRHFRDFLSPLGPLSCADRWFNARDKQDAVALYSLESPHFNVAGIENWNEVDNLSDNQHGIDGYLSDPEVARRLHAAVTAP